MSAGFSANDRPSALRSFPADLSDERLEYSGIYEDGWLSEHGFLVLSGKSKTKRMMIRGLIPGGMGLDAVYAYVKINGGSSIGRMLNSGEFELELPASEGQQRLEFSFSVSKPLPGGDGRPVSALLKSVVLE